MGPHRMKLYPADFWGLTGIAMICVGGLVTTGVWAAEVSQELRDSAEQVNDSLTTKDSSVKLPRESVLPLSLAMKAASAAMEQCTKDGYLVSVTVVDRAGVVRALLREDGAGPHTVDSSRKKAYTAASLKRTTGELAELITKIPGIESIREMNDNILILGGGLPIQLEGEVVGGIGVGGAPGAHLDVSCAQAGLESIGAPLKGHRKK